MTKERDVRVLYVDDESANRVVFEHSFSDIFDVITAASPTEALELIEGNNVGVLITDQRMPEMSGNDLLRRVREQNPEIVRIVVTAYSDLDPILAAVNEGLVARYIVKPWDQDELERMLRWGVHAYTVGFSDPDVQRRLMEVERLANLGKISAAVFHDLSQPLSYVYNNAISLQHMSQALPEVRDLVHAGANGNPVGESVKLLLEELPDISEDIVTGCSLMQEIHSDTRRLLRQRPYGADSVTDPKTCIDFALAVFRNQRNEVGVDLRLVSSEELPRVAVSNAELTQTVINLIANSLDAFKAGPPAEQGFVEVTAGMESEKVRIGVRDNAGGVPAAVKERIGQAFFSTRPEGTGLGLYQCRRIVEGCGGEFRLESEADVGTTVTLLLPVHGSS